MRNLSLSVAFLVLNLFALNLVAQNKRSIDFEPVNASTFILPDSSFLKDADAVIISDKGKCEFSGTKKGEFMLSYTRHVRTKILNANGYDVADFALRFFGDASNDETEIKAVTYNLDNGVIKETILQKEQVFVDKISSYHYTLKFTLPGITAGSIIDVQYTYKTPYWDALPTWYFQATYPTLWSEYEVEIPELLKYVFAAKGYDKLFLDEQKEYYKQYAIGIGNDYISIDGQTLLHRWVMKDVHAMKVEPFTSSIKNHLARLEFQLKRVVTKYSDAAPFFLSTWTEAVAKLNKSKYFGANLYTDAYWLDKEMKTVTGNSEDTLQKAKLIYENLKKNFTCTGNASYDIDKDGLHEVYKDRKGNSSEINLLLVAMLQHEHIDAYPVILSTKENGSTLMEYPLLRQYNRTIAYIRSGGVRYFLDASDPTLSFGKLNENYYNGHARIIVNDGIPVFLSPDSLKERGLTSLSISQDEKGSWKGSVTKSLGYFQSMDMRNDIKEKSKEEVIKKMQVAIGEAIINDVEIKNVENIGEPVTISFQTELNKTSDDLIYINPIMSQGYSVNPFKSAERSYPVEMPYVVEETIVSTIDIPQGYSVDDLPKNARVNLNEADGSFDYMIQVQEDKILLRSKLALKKATFSAEDYNTLRDFYAFVVKKQSEQIVFKKTR